MISRTMAPRKKQQYSEEQMQAAIYAVNKYNITVAKASVIYGIPKQTLRDRICKKYQRAGSGRPRALTQEEELADHFCNSIGILQQCAPSSPFPGFERPGNKSPAEPPQEDYAVLFSKLIARTAKDIDVVIDSLPSEESYMELQLASLKRLEIENQDAAHKLEEVVHKGELLLDQTQQALHDIAQSQLKSQALESMLLN